MKVSELKPFLITNWLNIKASLLEEKYKPGKIMRIEIPKANGGKRMLGIPTVLDRLIQ